MSRIRKVISILLILCFMIAGLPSQALAQTNSKEKPDLTISSVRELKEFANNVNNGNDYAGKLVKLTKDIKFDGVTVNNFTPVGYTGRYSGSYRQQFNGTFDGAGYSISGIDITNYEQGRAGLFGYIGLNGVVKNVTVKDSNISGIGGGAIAGYNAGSIENCQNNGVNIKDADSDSGGIAGNNSGTIINCISNGEIMVSKAQESVAVGGIVGMNGGNIYNSCNVGNVIYAAGELRYIYYIGGIAGDNATSYRKGTIQNCYNTGVISAPENVVYYGGIVGSNGSNGIVANSFCSEESAPQNIYFQAGTEKNNKALPVNEMKTASFAKMLNDNRGSNSTWLKWVSNSDYPTLVKLYEVTFSNTKHGSVKTNHSYAYSGQTVTLTVTADKKYKLSAIFVKTSSGKKVNVTKKNGKYQFKMPSERIKVTTTFKKK